MRPTKLELSGFTSFREPAVIDFEGADYYALVGPTGAGKSTIIDAICFALYGSVPRYEDKRLVAPVISQGELEAKVRLDFTLGPDRYTAVRVVRRGPNGASVKEARLEKEGAEEPLAGTGPQLTAAVTELLGLTFEHFTKCVVLPQGEFARFLHDDPKDRQEFLTKLLNLGIYGTMLRSANARAAHAKSQVLGLESRIEENAWATDERLKEAKGRVKRLSDLRKVAAEAQPSLDLFAKTIDAAELKIGEAERWLGLIEKLQIPDGVTELSDVLTAAKKHLKNKEAAATKARTEAVAAGKALTELPSRKPLDAAVGAHERRNVVAEKIAQAREVMKSAAEAAGKSKEGLENAEALVASAEKALADAQTAHRAQHLAQVLEVGAPCPVCLQEVGTLPQHDVPDDLDKAEKAVISSKSTLQTARDDSAKAAAALSSSETRLETLLADDKELELALEGAGDLATVHKKIAEIETAEEADRTARELEGRALDEVEAARKAVAGFEEEAAGARADFEEARDSLAPLQPPAASRQNLAADWTELISWATGKRPSLLKELKAAEGEIKAAEGARSKLTSHLEDSCSECEVDFHKERFLENVVEAHTSAERLVKDVQEAIGAAKEMRTQIADLRIEQETAHQLGQHLSAKTGGFVSWLVNEALAGLVVGATEILRQLSNDQYALTIDESGSFQVTDRNNADEVRSARTLSGGETFLASLSLALALADQLAELAAEGSARLDAIFLDEGFGTLDPETLDTVAATVENLAAEGRMVVVVTHVRDLADRIENQFRVKKDVRTSTIERVPA